MTALFITILNMSISASVVALAVMSVRIPLKKAPKIFSYVLWSVVLFRLVCPFSFESAFSLMPTSANAIPQDIVYSENPAIQTGVQFVDTPINAAINNALPSVSSENIMPEKSTETNTVNNANPIHAVLQIAGYIWLFGFISLLSYAAIGYIRLKRRVYYATLIRDNIYETDKIKTPFVFGFIRPKIYMPIGIDPSQHDYIVKHEQTHIRRRDNLIKPFAFIVFALHWFNPFMWAAYWLMAKDIEMSCDEAVLKKTDGDIRGVYSSSLLNLSVKRGSLLLTPLAFGESGVKERVKNVLNFKKPATWIIVVSLLAVSIFLIGFASNPANASSENDNDISALNATKLTMKDIYRACPETAVDEIVNDEVIGLLTAMYNNNEYLHMQKRLDWVYPYKSVNQESLEWLIDLFNEYEWRANRTTSSFEASDFDLFIELYTPDMACVLTFYGKYDIVLYQDKINNITTYYTYVLKDDSIYADLAGRLNMFYDNSVYSYSPMYSMKKDNDTAVSTVRENNSNDNPSGISTPSQQNNSNNPIGEKEDTKAKNDNNANMPTHDVGSIYASKDTVNEVKANLDEQGIKGFLEYDEFVLDVDRLVPMYLIYTVNKDNPPTTMIETLAFINSYLVPVTDLQGEILSIAELTLFQDKWTIASNSTGDNIGALYDSIQNAGRYIAQGSTLYYIDNHHYKGMLAVSENNEIFIPFTMYGGNRYYEPQNAKDILSEIIKEFTGNENNNNDG